MGERVFLAITDRYLRSGGDGVYLDMYDRWLLDHGHYLQVCFYIAEEDSLIC